MVAYTLYFHHSSIASNFVRYVFALRGPAKDAESEMTIEEKVVNVYVQEQLVEGFLCNINPKGQIPVLASIVLAKPMPDSQAITHYIMERYPRLAPPAHKAQIVELLEKLHGINFFSILFAGKQQLAKGISAKIEGLMADENISDRYREALRYKLEIYNKDKVAALNEGEPEVNHARAKALFAEVEPLLSGGSGAEGDGPWMWGLEYATAFDGHFVPVVARLMQAGFGDSVPDRIKAYAEQAMAGPEWKSIQAPQ